MFRIFRMQNVYLAMFRILRFSCNVQCLHLEILGFLVHFIGLGF